MVSGRRTGLLLFGLLSDMLKDKKVIRPIYTATQDTIALFLQSYVSSEPNTKGK